jgi:succinate dehydrogenase hydrophobic anchor subunit
MRLFSLSLSISLRAALTDQAQLSDPWWIYTTCNLFWVVKTHYGFGIIELVRECPRFGLMLASMCLSIVFIALDVISVTGALRAAMPLGINPFWKVRLPHTRFNVLFS